jgi:hypothetical protein
MARELNRGEIWLLDLPRPDKRRPVLNPDAAQADRPPAHRYGGRYHLHPSRRPHGGGSGHCRGTQRKFVRQPVQRFHRGAAPAANLCGERWSGQDAPGVPSADHRQRVRLSTEQTKRAATAPATAPAACSRATACTRALGGPKPRKLSDASLMITPPTLIQDDDAAGSRSAGEEWALLDPVSGGSTRPRVLSAASTVACSLSRATGGRSTAAHGCWMRGPAAKADWWTKVPLQTKLPAWPPP